MEHRFEIKPTNIPGLHDHFIDGKKVTRTQYVVEARRLFLEAALYGTLRVCVEATPANEEKAEQGEQTEESRQPSPPRLVSVSSVPSGGWVARLPRTREAFEAWSNGQRWPGQDQRPEGEG